MRFVDKGNLFRGMILYQACQNQAIVSTLSYCCSRLLPRSAPVQAHEVHVHKVYTREVHAYEVHAGVRP
jgi:hypothetical protein